MMLLSTFLYLGCGHCKAMKPAYGEAALMMKEKGVSITFDSSSHTYRTTVL